MSLVRNLAVTGAFGILASCSGGEVAPAPTTIEAPAPPEAPDVTEATTQAMDDALNTFDEVLTCHFTDNPEEFSLITNLVSHEFHPESRDFSFGLDIGDGYVIGIGAHLSANGRTLATQIRVIDTNGEEIEETIASGPRITLEALNIDPTIVDFGLPLIGTPANVMELTTTLHRPPGGHPILTAGCLSWDATGQAPTGPLVS